MTKKIKEIISKISDVKPHTIIHEKYGSTHSYEFVHNSSDEAKINLIKIIQKEFPQFVVSKHERDDGFTAIMLEEIKFEENPIFGGTMDNKKLLMYAALAVGGWYAWQMWQKKKLGAGVQSALTQGSTTAQQMVSFI